MTTFLVMERHTAADCPVNNEKTRKIVIEAASKIEELAKKHGVKPVAHWTIHEEHLTIAVYEAPSFEAFYEFRMEPELRNWRNYTTGEVYIPLTFEETMKIIKQAK